MLIESNSEFWDNYPNITNETAIVNILNFSKEEELIFLDLIENGVKIFPSALSQALSRSKCLQAYVFKNWLPPFTFVIKNRIDLLNKLNFFYENDITRVVTKLDRKNSGIGVNFWNSVEELYNFLLISKNDIYPFVIQPFLSIIKDIRVIIIGDYVEAYERHNKGPRKNLARGGHYRECTLSDDDLNLCQKVMKRGKFPYAHIDLLVTHDKTYLSEISLRGGIKGSKLTPSEYNKMIEEIRDNFKKNFIEANPDY